MPNLQGKPNKILRIGEAATFVSEPTDSEIGGFPKLGIKLLGAPIVQGIIFRALYGPKS